MKRKQFVRDLKRGGCILHRSGSRHDIYVNPRTAQKQPVPRHTEIDNDLAKHIRKYLGLE
jgi:predicted RNA binding protein YcfA (HicA-like mRNA interferase family)